MPRFTRDRLPELAGDFQDRVSLSDLRRKYRLSARSLLFYLVEARRENRISAASLNRLRLERRWYDFPRGREARLRAVLGCMNGELKQAILLLADEQPRTKTGIQRLLEAHTDEALPGSGTFYDYCFQTLTPAGFLIHDCLGKGLKARYNCFKLSAAGRRYGRPLAAYSLQYAVENKISLYELFGPTSSGGGSSGPYNRARIMELVAAGCNQIVSLAEQIGLSHTDISHHLRHLQAKGLLRFDSLTSAPGFKSYRWVRGRRPEEAKTIANRKKLTEAVIHWLYRHKQGDHRQIAGAVGCRHLQDVSKVLVGLAQQGLAFTEFSSTHRSRVELGKQAGPVLDYLKTVRGALRDGPELARITTRVKHWYRHPETLKQHLNAALALYMNISPTVNRKNSAEREEELIECIERFQSEQGRGPRPSEMMKKLGWNHGTLRIYLHSLLREGRLTRQQQKGSVRYRLQE